MFTAASRVVAQAVIQMRGAAGMTQRQLAAAIGREQNMVARIESGQRRIDLVEWVVICRACKVDPTAEISKLVQKISPITPIPHPRRSHRK